MPKKLWEEWHWGDDTTIFSTDRERNLFSSFFLSITFIPFSSTFFLVSSSFSPSFIHRSNIFTSLSFFFLTFVKCTIGFFFFFFLDNYTNILAFQLQQSSLKIIHHEINNNYCHFLLILIHSLFIFRII